MTKVDLVLARWKMREDVISAKQLMRDLVNLIGVGFHPDSRVDSYVNMSEPEPLFSEDAARELQIALDGAYELLATNGIDPCDVALPVQRRLLHID